MNSVRMNITPSGKKVLIDVFITVMRKAQKNPLDGATSILLNIADNLKDAITDMNQYENDESWIEELPSDVRSIIDPDYDPNDKPVKKSCKRRALDNDEEDEDEF